MGPAEGAGGVGEEPRVNAVGVEGVGAQREQPQRVPRGELAETDRAVEWRLRRRAAIHDITVAKDGERVDDGLVEARVVEAEEVLQLGGRRRRRRRSFVFPGLMRRRSKRSGHEVSGEEMENAKEEEDDGYDHYH